MIPLIYPQKNSSDEDLLKTPIHITEHQNCNNDSDSSIDEKTPRIIFKIKKYYIENWNQKAKKCGYWYINQVSIN